MGGVFLKHFIKQPSWGVRKPRDFMSALFEVGSRGVTSRGVTSRGVMSRGVMSRGVTSRINVTDAISFPMSVLIIIPLL